MKQEMNSLKKNEMRKLVDLPKDEKPISCKRNNGVQSKA